MNVEIENQLTKKVNEHEEEMHRFDEDIRTALFGPMKKPIEGSGRATSKGLVHQVSELHDQIDKAGSGLKAYLSVWDKVGFASILAIVEFFKWWLT